MKQLLVLASFFAIVFFLSGCQTDTPVSPNGDFTLEKPIKPNTIIGELLKDPDHNYLNLQVEWPAIRNATLYNVIVGTEYIIEAVSPPAHSATIYNVASVVPGIEVIVKIIAYKDKKGTNVPIAEGTQTFVYNPPPTDITVNSNVTPLASGILNFNADWDDVPGAVSYIGTFTRSFSGITVNFEVSNSDYLFSNASFESADGNFTITVQAKNSLGVVIASGSDTYEYTFTPPAVLNIPLGGELAINAWGNNYLDLLVTWAEVPDAVIYHCINFMSYNGQLFIDDHSYVNWGMSNVNPILAGVFNIITIEARDIDGNLIAWGTKTFTYTPAP